MVSLAVGGNCVAGPVAFDAALPKLLESGFKGKTQAVAAIEKSGDPRGLPLLQAMLDGRLFLRESDKRLVIAEASGDLLTIVDASSGQSLGQVPKSELDKVGINNQLRNMLKRAIAALSLDSPDPAVRLAAVQAMAAKADEATALTLAAAMEKESDARVLEAMQAATALANLGSADRARRLEAIETLGTSLLPEVRNRLTALSGKNADGSYVETDTEVRAAAIGALQRIEARVKFYSVIETIFFGISLGCVLVLAATGLAITFGVMGVINMAHGEMMMLGAYTTYVVQLMMPAHIDLSLLVAIPLAFLVSAAVGVFIERFVVRFLYGRPLETLLATFGISLFLQQLVRTVFTANNRPVSAPGWMSGQLEINPALALTYNRLYIIVFSLLVFAGLLMLLKRTTLGLQIRAVAQNRAMARAMGVRSNWIDAATFGLGSGVAGVAGVALSQLTNVGPNLGQQYIIDSFMVVVFGGVGNLWGTFVAGLSLGVANKFLEPFAGAVLAKILVLVFIILFIQRRPRGLFPQKGRSAEA
jgi:urea transport system permease protein